MNYPDPLWVGLINLKLKVREEKIMLVELEKHDIINLVTSANPPYALINEFKEKEYGSLCGGFAEKRK